MRLMCVDVVYPRLICRREECCIAYMSEERDTFRSLEKSKEGGMFSRGAQSGDDCLRKCVSVWQFVAVG